MANPVETTPAPEAPKTMPWEANWIEKPKQAIVEAVTAVKEAVGSIKMPWERDWSEKPRATVPEATKAPPMVSKGFDMKDYTKRLINAESGGDPNASATTSSAAGLAGFTKGAWLEQVGKRGFDYTLEDRKDPVKVQKVLEPLVEDNRKKAQKELGREPTHAELYMYHFMPAKAAKLITADPGTPATTLVSAAAAKANKPIFFNREGRTYTTPKTAGEVMAIFRRKMGEK